METNHKQSKAFDLNQTIPTVETDDRRSVIRHSLFGIRSSLAVTMLACVGAATAAEVKSSGPAERLVAKLSVDPSIAPDVQKLLKETWEAEADPNGAEFLTQALAVLYPKFREVLEAFEADTYDRCATVAAGLISHNDLYVAINAAVYEIKSLVALERLIEAGERIAKLLENPGEEAIKEYSYFAAEVAFLQGYCLVADLRYKQGTEVLTKFLVDYPQAPLRLTIAAKQMLTELANREPESVGEVVDLMDFSHKRLNQGDSGKVVQTRQERIIDLLDRLIKEAEDHEKNCKCSKCSGGSGGGRGSNTPMPQSPMPESQLPKGAVPEGDLREARRANPAESWGALPPLERERILQALRESFPSRYRQLVEQYYEQLAKKQ